MKFFQKKKQNQDQFKRLIHRLSEMPDIELTKVEQLVEEVFGTNYMPNELIGQLPTNAMTEEQNLDELIQEVKTN